MPSIFNLVSAELLGWNSEEHCALPEKAQKMVDAWAIHGLIEGGAMISKGDTGLADWDIQIAERSGSPTEPYNIAGLTPDHHWHHIFPSATEHRGIPWSKTLLRDAINKGEAAALSLGQLVMLAGDFYATYKDMQEPVTSTPDTNKPVTSEPVNLMKGVQEHRPLALMIFDAAKWKAGDGMPFDSARCV